MRDAHPDEVGRAQSLERVTVAKCLILEGGPPGITGMILTLKNALTLVLAAGAVLLASPAGWAAEVSPAQEQAQPPLNDTIFGRAVRMERAISAALSSTTGLAISPLLGMGVLGLWQYAKAPAGMRGELPWFAHPVAWGACFLLFFLRTVKDTAGIVVPEMLKKPLTVMEVMENQLSAAVVALAVLPVSVTAAVTGAAVPSSAGAFSGGAAGLCAVVPVSGWPLLVALMIPVLLIFAMVSTVSHAVKCLLLLSPSSLVTAGIKFAKGGFLALFAVTAYLVPWVGLVLSVVIILICARLFGWAFRWNVYGTLFAWDFFSGRSDRPLGEGEPLRGFFFGGGSEVPARTYGEIHREGEELKFRYRPWLVFPERTHRLVLAGKWLGLRKGLLFPSVTSRPAGTVEPPRTMFEMRLRYRGHEDEVAARLGAGERLPSRVIQGARNALAWLWEQVRGELGGGRAALPGS